MGEEFGGKRVQFKKRVEETKQRIEIAAKSVNIGKAGEKIALSLRGGSDQQHESQFASFLLDGALQIHQ